MPQILRPIVIFTTMTGLIDCNFCFKITVRRGSPKDSTMILSETSCELRVEDLTLSESLC